MTPSSPFSSEKNDIQSSSMSECNLRHKCAGKRNKRTLLILWMCVKLKWANKNQSWNLSKTSLFYCLSTDSPAVEKSQCGTAVEHANIWISVSLYLNIFVTALAQRYFIWACPLESATSNSRKHQKLGVGRRRKKNPAQLVLCGGALSWHFLLSASRNNEQCDRAAFSNQAFDYCLVCCRIWWQKWGSC